MTKNNDELKKNELKMNQIGVVKLYVEHILERR